MLYNNDSQEFETFTTAELLEMINRDRSHEWSNYNENSTIKEITEVVNDMCMPYQVDVDMPFSVRSK